MCIICTDPNCDHGERCGRVKIYKEGGFCQRFIG